MKYMMMMHAPRAGWKDAGIGTWPVDDIKAHIAFMHRFNKELTDSGEFVDAQGLAGPEQAESCGPGARCGPLEGGQHVGPERGRLAVRGVERDPRDRAVR